MKYREEESHVDYDEKEKSLFDTISRITEGCLIYRLLRKGLENFDGKKLTKRAIHPIKSKGFTVSWEKDQWTITIHVWGENIDFRERYYFSIPCKAHEGSIFSLEEFDKKYYHHSKEKTSENIAKYQAILDNLVDYVVEYNLAVDEYNESLKRLKEADHNFSSA